MIENYNKEPYNIMIECPICLEYLDLSNNVILTTDCCYQDAHLNCITKWIKNPNNKNNLLCPICRQTSELLKDINGPQTYEQYSISQDNNNQFLERIVNISSPSESTVSINTPTFIEVLVQPRRSFGNFRNARIISALCAICFMGFIMYIVMETCIKEENCN